MADPSPLEDASFHLVTNLDEALEFKRWLGTRHEEGTLAFDTETSGLSPYARGARIRLAQFGDTKQGWAIPWEDWRGLILEALTEWDGPLVGHHTKFDVNWVETHSDLRIRQHRLHDTMIQARIINPLGSGALKPLSDSYIDSRASYGQQMLDQAFKEQGWTWDTVPITFWPYWTYACCDTVITAQLHNMFYPRMKPGTSYSPVYEMEMAVSSVLGAMERRGARVDVEYCHKMQQELLDKGAMIREWGAREHGISLGSGPQLAGRLTELGVEIRQTTPTGQPKIDKWQLQIAADPDNGYSYAAQELANRTLEMRQSEKTGNTYFRNFADMSVDEVVHPSIHTIGARTGRMCLPTDHRLLTRRGPVAVDDVRIGDETLDEHNNWVKVICVHRYLDQEVVVRQSSRVKLEATAEHRWVLSNEYTGKRFVEPLTDTRRIIHLTPDAEAFDFTSRTLHIKSDGEQFATLIGLLVSDGRVAESGYGEGLIAAIYQTESKFYAEFKDAIPSKAVSYDRITANTAMGPHHEIGLRARWLRPRLAAAGLEIPEDGSPLRLSESLISWVLRLPVNEVAAFLQAVWLSDGTTAHPVNKKISCGSEPLRLALQIAGYRCGLRSHVTNDGIAGWATKDRLGVKFTDQRVLNRALVKSTRRTDVWCVSTETGTFTAWRDGPYLTGNSISEPSLQQVPKRDSTVRRAFIPREGNMLVTSDYNQIEMRMVAHFSGDHDLAAAFATADATGSDFFTELGKSIYSPTFVKTDKRRSLIKNTLYGMCYGAGAPKMAESAGVPIERMRSVIIDIETRFPGIRGFMRKIEDMGVRRERAEGEGYVITPLGRRLPCDTGKVYALTNYIIQSTAADMFKQGLLRLDSAGYGEWMLLPVHDEILLDIPREHVLDAVEEVPQILTDNSMEVSITADADGPWSNWGERYA